MITWSQRNAIGYKIKMKKETQLCCAAFVQRRPARAERSESTGEQLVLHGSIIAEHITHEGKECFAFCLCGWPSPITLDRLNGVTEIAFGRKMFFKKKGRVYFGDTVLREIDPREKLYIPVDMKIGDHHNAERTSDLHKDKSFA